MVVVEGAQRIVAGSASKAVGERMATGTVIRVNEVGVGVRESLSVGARPLLVKDGRRLHLNLVRSENRAVERRASGMA